jgi:hypothetical protein
VLLPKTAAITQFDGMKALTKPKKSAASASPRRVSVGGRIKGLSPRRTPPVTVGTVGDVLKMGESFGKGADWDVIEAAHAARD